MFVLVSLLAAACASAVNFADKGFLGKYGIDYKSATVFATIAAGALALVLLPTQGIGELTAAQAGLVVLSGMIVYACYFLYWNTMSRTNASFVVMILQLIPVATLTLSYVFLGERLDGRYMIGFVVIVAAVLGFAYQPPKNGVRFAFDEAIFTGFATALLFGVAAIVQKFAVEHTAVLPALGLESLGVCIAGIFAYIAMPSMRRGFFGVMKAHGTQPLFYIFTVEAVWLLYRYLSYEATSLGPVSLERALEGTRIFFALGFGIALSYLAPTIFAAERKNLTFVKLAFVALLFVGIYLIS